MDYDSVSHGKRPKGYQAAVLYLDFDGVLHPEDVFRNPKRGAIYFGSKGQGHALFENANLLISALEPFPQVKVVLSTTWVQVFRFERAKRFLPIPLSDRVIGATYHSAMSREKFGLLTRAQQVLADVGRRKPSAWLALDDDNVGWPESHLEQLVLTDATDGIATPVVLQELHQKLIDTFSRR